MFGRNRFAPQPIVFSRGRRTTLAAKGPFAKKKVVRRPVRLVVARKPTSPKVQARVAVPWVRKPKAGGTVLRFRAPVVAPKKKKIHPAMTPEFRAAYNKALRTPGPGLLRATAGAVKKSVPARPPVRGHHTIAPSASLSDDGEPESDQLDEEEESPSSDESESLGPEDDESSGGSESSGEGDSGDEEESEDVGALVTFDGSDDLVVYGVVGGAAAVAIAFGYYLGKKKRGGR